MNSIGMRLFVLIAIFITIFSSLLIYRTYKVTNQHVFQIVSQEADMALQFNLSIRDYVRNHIRPIMYEFVGEEEFVPETMSTSFVARSIFEDTREHFPDFILKFSSDNPRNPRNQVGPEELKIIRYFNENPAETLWEGNITISGGDYFAKFKPRRMEESCLRCHGDPADAPESLLQRYGSTAGFYRPLGEVIALDAVAIPTRNIQKQLWAEFKKSFTMIGISFVVLLILVFMVVRLIITNRLSKITKHFADAASQTDYVPIDPITVQGKDEIRALADGFNSLAGKMARYQASLENVFNSANPLCITNLDYELVQANEAYYAVWPRPEKQTESVKCYESRSGPSCKTDRCPLNQIVHGKEEVVVESTKFKINGKDHQFIITARPFRDAKGEIIGIVESFQDISNRVLLEREKEQLIEELRESLNKVKLLSGFLPICASCKKIRDDKGYWKQIEAYIKDHSEAEFSHGICPECANKLYPELQLEDTK
jgi:PAS domain-containing protein